MSPKHYLPIQRWGWPSSRVTCPDKTYRWLTGGGLCKKACSTRPVKRIDSAAHIYLRTLQTGYWRRTTSTSTWLAGGHSGITPRLQWNPSSIGYLSQRHRGWWSAPSRDSWDRQWDEPTFGFTSCTAMCGKLFLFWRKLNSPTPDSWLRHVCASSGAQQTPTWHLLLHRGGAKGSGGGWWTKKNKRGMRLPFGHMFRPLRLWLPFDTWTRY